MTTIATPDYIYAASIKLDLGNPFVIAFLSLVVIGIIYSLLDFISGKILQFIIPESKRENHILERIPFWVAVFLIIADIFLVILPVFGIEILPFNLLDIIRLTQ